MCIGCKANAVWQHDYGAFLKQLVDLAPQPKARIYASRFEGKEVTWVLHFEKIGKDKEGNPFLNFDMPPLDLGETALLLRFKPAPGTSEDWKGTPPGEMVKISAVVAKVAFDKRPLGKDPAKMLFIGAASLENVRLVRQPL